MKLPKTLKIGGRKYKVIYPYHFRDTTTTTLGLHDPSGSIIRISDIDEHGNVRSDFSILHTFLHELIHAVDFVYNNNCITLAETGEGAIDQLAEGLLQVLRDNKLSF